MRRKSFISPCKEINTEQLFKNIHFESAHCKTQAAEDINFKLHRTKIFGGSTQGDMNCSQSRWLVVSTTKNSASRNLRIRTESRQRRSISFASQELPSRHQFLRTPQGIDKNQTFESFKNNTNSVFSLKQLLARPNTSYNYSIEDSQMEHLRPLTNAMATRLKPRHNRTLTYAKQTSHEELQFPEFTNKVYVPRLWKRLKTLKTNKRKKTNKLDVVVFGVKAK